MEPVLSWRICSTTICRRTIPNCQFGQTNVRRQPGISRRGQGPKPSSFLRRGYWRCEISSQYLRSSSSDWVVNFAAESHVTVRSIAQANSSRLTYWEHSDCSRKRGIIGAPQQRTSRMLFDSCMFLRMRFTDLWAHWQVHGRNHNTHRTHPTRLRKPPVIIWYGPIIHTYGMPVLTTNCSNIMVHISTQKS